MSEHEIERQDIIKPQDLENELSREEPLISDQEIIQLLKTIGPALHQAIQEAGTFFNKELNGKLADAMPMDKAQFELWTKNFNIAETTKAGIDNGELYVPDMANEQKLPEPDAIPHPESSSQLLEEQGKNEKKYRVNLDEKAEHYEISPLTPQGLKLSITPHIYFGGAGQGGLYNAFVSFDVYLKDNQDRIVISKIPGTGYNGDPVYSPFRPCETSIWFNTSVKPSENNSLKISLDKPDFLMIGCNINRIDQLDNIEIPDNPKLKLFFWELQKYLSDQPKPLAGPDTQEALEDKSDEGIIFNF